jgi:predicted nucleic-acid-binding protein
VEGRVTSPIAVLELKSVVYRTTNIGEHEIEALVDYIPEINVDVPEIDMDKVINNAIEMVFKVRIKTPDILHISASLILGSDTFVTLDREFVEREKEIGNLGLRIRSV